MEQDRSILLRFNIRDYPSIFNIFLKLRSFYIKFIEGKNLAVRVLRKRSTKCNSQK